jgi:RNA polymerase sigma-B factor
MRTLPAAPSALSGSDDDRALLARWREAGDRAARTRLVERHLPLARRLAARYGGGYDGGEDLQQVAAMGLVKAIDRFDPDRGLALSTFAVPTILGELKRHLRDTSWAVRVPRDLQELALRVEREAGRLERALGRAPTVAEVALEAGVGVEATLEAMEARRAHRALSLDAPQGADEGDSEEMSAHVGRLDPDMARAEDRALLAPLLARLPQRDQEILRLRFGEDMTQSEIGRRLGVSQMHVSRLIRRALARASE